MSSHREELKCLVCDYKSYDDSKMKEHASSHGEEFTCSECGNRFTSQEDLVAHMTKHRKPLKCHKCKYNCVFESEKELGEHMLTHMTETEHTSECTDIHENPPPVISQKPFSCSGCDDLFETDSELESHARVHLTKSALRCQQCTYTTLITSEFMKHMTTHFDENSFDCPKCDFKTPIQYELVNHDLHYHVIENDYTPHEDLASLDGHQPNDKTHTESNTNVIIPDNTSVKEKTYVCPTCDYRCSSNAAMKTHMHIHTIPTIYICDTAQCNFESESKEDLQVHKTGHLPPKDMNYSAAIKQSEINKQEHNQHEWVGPIRNGKPMRNKPHNNQSNFDQHRSETNNTHGYYNNNRNNQGGPHKQSRARSNIIKGSNSNSSLSVAPRPHLAKVFASGFVPGTNPNYIKKDLEENIHRLTGEKYDIQIEKLTTRLEYYSSFKISCYCIDSDIFMNSNIWPTNVLIKWFRERRSPKNGPELRPQH